MKLLQKEISKEGGRVSLIAEDAEDMWTVYNLLVSCCFSQTKTFFVVPSENDI
jgi:hypothetical protein